MSNRVRTALLVIVVLVWAVNFSAPLWIKEFKPSEALNAVFMIVVGYLTTGYRNKNNDRERERENDGVGNRDRVDLRRRSDRSGDTAGENNATDEQGDRR